MGSTLLSVFSSPLLTTSFSQKTSFYKHSKKQKKTRDWPHMVFGIRPQKPETGYGYIKVENPQINTPAKVEAFVKNPIMLVQKNTSRAALISGIQGSFSFRSLLF